MTTTRTSEASYPMHERLAEEIPLGLGGRSRARRSDVSQVLGEFVKWLEAQGIVLAHHTCRHGTPEGELCNHWECRHVNDGEAQPEKLRLSPRRLEDLLGGFFNVDHDELMREKDRMLEDIRNADTVSGE